MLERRYFCTIECLLLLLLSSYRLLQSFEYLTKIFNASLVFVVPCGYHARTMKWYDPINKSSITDSLISHNKILSFIVVFFILITSFNFLNWIFNICYKLFLLLFFLCIIDDGRFIGLTHFRK